MTDVTPRLKRKDDDRQAFPSAPDFSLVLALRDATGDLHTQAERSGFVREILQGRADRPRYTLLLRNLLPVYRELELGLQRQGPGSLVRNLILPELFRAAAIERDLIALAGADWAALATLPAGEAYRLRVAEAASGNGARLVAHAYTRYLGDLSGAQVLRRLLVRDLALGPGSLALYDFPAIEDFGRFKAGYRLALDQAGHECRDREAVIAEAIVAFELNIALSDAVQSASPA